MIYIYLYHKKKIYIYMKIMYIMIYDTKYITHCNYKNVRSKVHNILSLTLSF